MMRAKPWEPNQASAEPPHKGKPWEGFIDPTPEEANRGRAEFEARYQASPERVMPALPWE